MRLPVALVGEEDSLYSPVQRCWAQLQATVAPHRDLLHTACDYHVAQVLHVLWVWLCTGSAKPSIDVIGALFHRKMASDKKAKYEEIVAQRMEHARAMQSARKEEHAAMETALEQVKQVKNSEEGEGKHKMRQSLTYFFHPFLL